VRLIPTSDFSGAKTSDFVYLYAHFGNSDASESGFEEWALVNVAPIPETDALFPITGFFAVAFAMQRLRRAQQVSTMYFVRAGLATRHSLFERRAY
jgi:hypothetical protein